MPVISNEAAYILGIHNFDEWKRDWEYSGIFGDRPNAPTSISADQYLNSTGYYRDTSSWSNVQINTDYVSEVSNKFWYVRKKFFIAKGTYSYQYAVDDDIAGVLVPPNANGTLVFGSVSDIDGGGAHTQSGTFTVNQPGLYYFTVRGCEGGGSDLAKIESMSPIAIRKWSGGGYGIPVGYASGFSGS